MSQRYFTAFLLAAAVLAAVQFPGNAQTEPSAAVAKMWWPEQYNVWTPVSWPDHYFKFNVFYNGSVVLSPSGAPWKPHSHKWIGQDFQLTFRASPDGASWAMPQAINYILREWDGGLGIQHWDSSHEAPVLSTEFRNKDGMVMETSLFSHIPGGGEVKTSLEPLFARIRVRIKHIDGNYPPAGPSYRMSVLLSRIYVSHCDFGKLAPDILITPASASAVMPMSIGRFNDGYGVFLEDGKLRLAAFPGPDAEVSMVQEQYGYNLQLTLPKREGAFVDLVVPMLPEAADVVEAESDITYDDALAEADRYWESLKDPGAAVFDVPEEEINASVAQNIKFVPVIAERDYQNGEYCYVSGTWGYDALWPTPGAFVGIMLDYLGYGSMVEKYDAVFAHTQGQVTPPGSFYKPHPGYFGTPRHLQSIDWMTDHGAIMWQVATHALLSGDPDFTEVWTGPLLKACDFIIDYSNAEHPGVPGLLPAGWATDEATSKQAIWNLAWNYKGLCTTARLLERTGHPRAGEIAAFARDFKERFVSEYRKIVEAGPRWKDASGRDRYEPPTSLSNEVEGYHSFMSDAFYLDCGPLCLVWAGLLDADDPIMVDILDFFREGPNWELRKPFAWSCDRPVLEHEISTCEPCYSFNAFHNWQKGDREHYLEAMYSILIGAVSQNTYISCEHRHGMQGTQFAFPLGFMLARLAVIDEQIVPGDLHLLRFCPLAWLRSDRPARFLRMPTEFGPVDLKVQLSEDGRTLDVNFSGEWRDKPGRTVLHVPPVPGLKRVCVNGKRYSASKALIILK